MGKEILQMTDEQIAGHLSKTFPQMDAYLYGKAKRPNLSGVRLTELAENIVHELIYGEESCYTPHRRVERLDMKKCTVRIPESVVARLQTQMEAFGVYEWNALINMMICKALSILEGHDYGRKAG